MERLEAGRAGMPGAAGCGDAGLSDTMRAWFLLAAFADIAPARGEARTGWH